MKLRRRRRRFFWGPQWPSIFEWRQRSSNVYFGVISVSFCGRVGVVLSWEARLVSPQQSNSPGLNLGEFRFFFSQAVSTMTTVQDLEIRKQCLHRTALPNFDFFFFGSTKMHFASHFAMQQVLQHNQSLLM